MSKSWILECFIFSVTNRKQKISAFQAAKNCKYRPSKLSSKFYNFLYLSNHEWAQFQPKQNKTLARMFHLSFLRFAARPREAEASESHLSGLPSSSGALNEKLSTTVVSGPPFKSWPSFENCWHRTVAEQNDRSSRERGRTAFGDVVLESGPTEAKLISIQLGWGFFETSLTFCQYDLNSAHLLVNLWCNAF